jgi:hypothetical protein
MSVRSDAPNVGQNASAEGGKSEVDYGSGIPNHTSLLSRTRFGVQYHPTERLDCVVSPLRRRKWDPPVTPKSKLDEPLVLGAKQRRLSSSRVAASGQITAHRPGQIICGENRLNGERAGRQNSDHVAPDHTPSVQSGRKDAGAESSRRLHTTHRNHSKISRTCCGRCPCAGDATRWRTSTLTLAHCEKRLLCFLDFTAS